jgi:hypothetical protein
LEVIAVVVTAMTSLLIFYRRARMIEKLCRMADRSGSRVTIRGLNPLAVNVEYVPIEKEGDHSPSSTRLAVPRRTGSA